jgi:hypothetical protein
MKVIRSIEQRSWDWFQMRAGKVTASGIGKLITDKFALRKWSTEMPNSYLHLKLAEKWRGIPEEQFGGNRQTDQGVFAEPQAFSVYSALQDRPVERIAGIDSETGLWCSPDGWLRLDVPPDAEGDAGLELKCPMASTHIGYLLAGVLPEEYVLQVQFSMFVTGAAKWHFFSFCKDLPDLFVEVQRDPSVIEAIEVATELFREKFEAGWVRLCDLNGGPPPPRVRVDTTKQSYADWQKGLERQADANAGVTP